MFCLRILEHWICNILHSEISWIQNEDVWGSKVSPTGQSAWYQHDDIIVRTRQRRFHTGPVVCIYCPWTVTALAWGTTICRTDSLRGGKWMLVFNVSVLDNRCQCWVREVTKAIFSWLIEPGTCLLQDVLPSFMWRCETNILSTCDATWMLLQKRNQRHSMVCLCVSCHFVYVTFGLVSRNKHYGISRAPEL